MIKQLALMFFSFAAMYAALFAASMVFTPDPKVMDTLYSRDTIYATDPKYVVMGRHIFRDRKDRVYLLGASNTAHGLRPDIIQKRIPGYEVNSLSVMGSNSVEIYKTIELLKQALPAGSSNNNVIVIGLTWALFASEDTRYSKVDLEKLRYGLYREKPEGIIPIVPPEYIPLASQLLRPYLMISHCFSNVKQAALRAIGKGKDDDVAVWLGQDNLILDEKAKAVGLEFVASYIGTKDEKLSDEQIHEFLKTIDIVEREGWKLYIVDLPTPDWIMEESPTFRDYQSRKLEIINYISRKKHVYYLNFQDMDDSSTFVDAAHPKMSAARIWSDRLGRELSASLSKN